MFRDDHDAALARITALEAELERQQADDADREGRITELEQELAAARAKIPKDVPKPAVRRTPKRDPEPHGAFAVEEIDLSPPPPSSSGRVAAIAVAIFLIAIVVVGVILILTDHPRT